LARNLLPLLGGHANVLVGTKKCYPPTQ